VNRTRAALEQASPAHYPIQLARTRNAEVLGGILRANQGAGSRAVLESLISIGVLMAALIWSWRHRKAFAARLGLRIAVAALLAARCRETPKAAAEDGS
jgi:hypothetical protein